MMVARGFLDLPDSDPRDAEVILLPLPFEGTVSWGRGTARGPDAVLDASRQVETWDEETDFDLKDISFHWSQGVSPADREKPGAYLDRVLEAARAANEQDALVIGVGGEHSVSTPLAIAAAGQEDLSGLTVVQLDAHADLRETYGGSEHSHACVMRRLLDRGASILAIGVRSASRNEAEHGQSTGRWEPWYAHRLAAEGEREDPLLERLRSVEGEFYLTIDTDCLEVTHSPSTGTPEPGGLRWWQAMKYLRTLLQSSSRKLAGLDIVETVPCEGTTVNEYSSARILCKALAYLHSYSRIAG